MAEHRTTNAATLITALGGDLSTGMCLCPAHDDKKPSLHVSDGKKGVVFHCHAKCPQGAVIGALKLRGLWGSGSSAPRPKQENLPPDLEAYGRFRRALAILRAAAQAEAGQPIAYLQARGIEKCPPCAMLLPAKDSRRLLGHGYPAMVCPIVGPQGLQGAHVTFLNLEATAKLRTDVPRKSFGQVSGGYVVLGPLDSDKPLVVSEGVETGLSAAQVTGLPAIAALNAGNLAKVKPRRVARSSSPPTTTTPVGALLRC